MSGLGSFARTGAVAAVVMLASSLTAPLAGAQAFNGSTMIGTCTGTKGALTDANASCGVAGANGVVTTSGLAGSNQYGWISTRGGTTDNSVQLPGVTIPPGRFGSASPVNGTAWTFNFFANAGDVLSFRFNYITSDGFGYEDYGYAKFDEELLFTARSSPAAYAVPGAGMPVQGLYSGAPTGPIDANKTTWAGLGQWSNSCWDAGCGFTGWLSTQYTITTTGTHALKFGVVNLNDQLWDTGLAFDFNLAVTGYQAPPTPFDPPTPVYEVSAGCDEKEYETEEEEEDGIVTTTVKIKQGSCDGDDALKFDDSYGGQIAQISQELPPSTTVPEPTSVALVAAGLAALMIVRRRK
jgi:PEP-CTERM motif